MQLKQLYFQTRRNQVIHESTKYTETIYTICVLSAYINFIYCVDFRVIIHFIM